MENTLFQQLRDFITEKKTYTNLALQNSFKRANIVPTGQFQFRDAYSPNGVHTGSYGVEKEVYRPTPQQRAKNLIEELGIKFIQGLTANAQYPLIDGNISQWVEECEAGNIENTTFTSITLSPRRLLSYVELGNELVLNPTTDLLGAVEEDMKEAIYAKVLDTMLKELVTNHEAETNPTTYTIAEYSDIIDLELVASGKKMVQPIYLVSPTAASKLKAMTTTVFPVMIDGKINGFQVIETPYLDNEDIILADWTRLVLGNFGGFDVTVDDITQQHLGIIRLIINSWWDWDILDSNSFLYATTASTEGNS